jgi:transcriptional regulator with XRE-family HTH domain
MPAEDAQETPEATLPADVPPLRQLRRLRGWTQAQLAEAAGVTRVTIQKLERGVREPRPSTMVAVARALGVEIRQVDEFREPPPRRP